jgi:hypothetical protein
MLINEINSNTIKTISTSLIDSIIELSKCKNLDSFYRYYMIYDDAWKSWNKMISLLSENKENEYKLYAYSLLGSIGSKPNILTVSFDPNIKTIEDFYAVQTKSGRSFPFSMHEILAWDEKQFIINDFLQSSVVVLNRLDKIKNLEK